MYVEDSSIVFFHVPIKFRRLGVGTELLNTLLDLASEKKIQIKVDRYLLLAREPWLVSWFVKRGFTDNGHFLETRKYEESKVRK